MQYLVVIEQGQSSFGAYVPDLPGCIAAADTREEVASLIQEAIELHIEDLKSQGHQVPSPHSSSQLVSIDA
jgi:predicted RNase H-like HicB family nuclease